MVITILVCLKSKFAVEIVNAMKITYGGKSLFIFRVEGSQ